MPGTIHKRGRSFALRLYAGQENGVKKYRWLTFKTRAEAEAAQSELASHMLAHSAGVGLFGSPRERLGPYLTDWLKRQKPRLAPGTYRRYETFIRQVRRDALGTVPLARLAPRALEGYYARLLERGLSSTTANHQHRMLSKALKDAARQDLILQNPAALAGASKRLRARPEIWTEAQTLLFLSEAKASSQHYPVYLFIIGTGARVGEALGLRWRDLDLREGVVRITQALQRVRGVGPVFKEPKTERSCRAIVLPPEVVNELRTLRDRRGGKGDGLVFCQANGRPLHDGNIRRRDVRRICEKLGLSWRRALHNARHGHATSLLSRGVDVKTVQARLGHASASFTLNTYAHVLAGTQERAAQAVSAMLAGQ